MDANEYAHGNQCRFAICRSKKQNSNTTFDVVRVYGCVESDLLHKNPLNWMMESVYVHA